MKKLQLATPFFTTFDPMNFFTFILALYLLGLSFVPCGDVNECNQKSIITISATNNDGHKHDSEHCTPMCHCSCCAASAYVQSATFYKVPKRFYPSAKYPVSEITFSSQISFSIWQPPKLS